MSDNESEVTSYTGEYTILNTNTNSLSVSSSVFNEFTNNIDITNKISKQERILIISSFKKYIFSNDNDFQIINITISSIVEILDEIKKIKSDKMKEISNIQTILQNSLSLLSDKNNIWSLLNRNSMVWIEVYNNWNNDPFIYSICTFLTTRN